MYVYYRYSIEIHVFSTKYIRRYTRTQTRNTHGNTFVSAQGNHRHINKHKTQVKTHQQAQTQACAHTQYDQRTHKNINKHKHRHNHMCVCEEGFSGCMWVDRVRMSVFERKEEKSGQSGARKGTGEELFDMHDHGGTQREKSNTRNRPKKTTKTTFTVQQKYRVLKQCI